MEMDYHPYDLRHVVTQLQLLAFGALGFITLVKSGVYPDEKRAVHVDAEWLYRKAGPWLLGSLGRAVMRVDVYVRSSVLELIGVIIHGTERTHGSIGPLAKSWRIGRMVFCVAIVLVGYLLFYL